MNSRWWTNKEEAYLREAYKSTKDVPKICFVLGRSVLSVRDKTYKLCIVKREDYWSPQDVETLRQMTTAGESFRAIASKLGRTRNACIGKAHRLDIHTGPREPDKEAMRARAQARWDKLGPKMWKARKEAKKIKAWQPPKSKVVRQVIGVPALNPLESTPIHLVQIRNGQCRFIEGDDRMCCARETLNGFSYCAHHYARSYQLDRRSASMASIYQQSMADRTRQKHTESELQELDRGSAISAGHAESEASNW